MTSSRTDAKLLIDEILRKSIRIWKKSQVKLWISKQLQGASNHDPTSHHEVGVRVDFFLLIRKCISCCWPCQFVFNFQVLGKGNSPTPFRSMHVQPDERVTSKKNNNNNFPIIRKRIEETMSRARGLHNKCSDCFQTPLKLLWLINSN